jgi:hypothetical protein
MFCKHFGREDGADDNVARQRKRTTNEKYFCSPWRSDNFSSHLRKQHKSKWDEYNNFSNEPKKAYFVDNESEQVVNMQSFVQPEASMKARLIAKQKCTFFLDSEDVEYPEATDTSQLQRANRNSLSCFVYKEEKGLLWLSRQIQC